MSIFLERRQKNRPEKLIHHIEIPPTIPHGYHVYHHSFDYPKKGFVNEYVIQVNNYAKAGIITWIRLLASKQLLPLYLVFLLFPRRMKIKIAERFIREIADMGLKFLDSYNHKHYLNFLYYCEISRELDKFLSLFLKNLGISELASIRFAFMFASLIEYDTAYRYPLEDLFSASSAEKLIENPRKEVTRLAKVFVQRTKKKDLPEKFLSFGRLLGWMLIIPRIKKAFIKALKKIEFTKLQLDEIDSYQARNGVAYDFYGMTKEERDAKWPLENHTVLFPTYENVTDQELHKMFIEDIAEISP